MGGRSSPMFARAFASPRTAGRRGVPNCLSQPRRVRRERNMALQGPSRDRTVRDNADRAGVCKPTTRIATAIGNIGLAQCIGPRRCSSTVSTLVRQRR
jgi:hypothetical protein